MCGIVGFVDYSRKSTQNDLENMTNIIHHRGPDDSGYSFLNNEIYNIGLGHKRLSILDLSKHGHQPMTYNTLEIVYNGEVYNFKEIREELISLNYTFHSDSDTEVILKAYNHWGIKSVDKFNGMFAISIYDKEANKLVLIRDRAGVKPLYWYHHNNLFMFASELKSFHQNKYFKKEIDKESLSLYLQFSYIPQPYTIFKNTHKLKAGYYLEIDLKSQKISKRKYWDVIDFYNKPKIDISDKEAIDKTEELFQSAFNYRMVSDVPVGVFLSGGYDSSTVAAIIQNQISTKLNTYTIGFKEKGFDESPYAKEVSKYLGTNHTEYYCTHKEATDIIPTLCEIYDEPFGDSSTIPTILVSKLARKDVTVSLSADGGDEIFAGYEKYDMFLNYHQKLNKIPNILSKTTVNIMNKINPDNIPVFKNQYNYKTRYEKIQALLKYKDNKTILESISQYFSKKQSKDLLLVNKYEIKTDFDSFDLLDNSNDIINKVLAVDYKTYLSDDILVKVDRATMSVSLEGREPLLDHNIIEFAAQLPSNLKYRNGDKKWLLKQVTHKYLPKKMMDRSKMGFGSPLQEWFKDNLKDYFFTYLNRERLEKEGLFDVDEVLKIRDRYLNGNKESIQKLWLLLVFEMWYEKWM